MGSGKVCNCLLRIVSWLHCVAFECVWFRAAVCYILLLWVVFLGYCWLCLLGVGMFLLFYVSCWVAADCCEVVWEVVDVLILQRI